MVTLFSRGAVATWRALALSALSAILTLPLSACGGGSDASQTPQNTVREVTVIDTWVRDPATGERYLVLALRRLGILDAQPSPIDEIVLADLEQRLAAYLDTYWHRDGEGKLDELPIDIIVGNATRDFTVPPPGESWPAQVGLASSIGLVFGHGQRGFEWALSDTSGTNAYRENSTTGDPALALGVMVDNTIPFVADAFGRPWQSQMPLALSDEAMVLALGAGAEPMSSRQASYACLVDGFARILGVLASHGIAHQVLGESHFNSKIDPYVLGYRPIMGSQLIIIDQPYAFSPTTRTRMRDTLAPGQ